MSYEEFLNTMATAKFDEEKAKELTTELKALFIEQEKQRQQMRLTTHDLNQVCDL